MRYFTAYRCTYCSKCYAYFEPFKRHTSRHQRNYGVKTLQSRIRPETLCHSSLMTGLKKCIMGRVQRVHKQTRVKCKFCEGVVVMKDMMEHMLNSHTSKFCSSCNTYCGIGYNASSMSECKKLTNGKEREHKQTLRMWSESKGSSATQMELRSSPANPEHACMVTCGLCKELVFIDNMKMHMVNSHNWKLCSSCRTYCGGGHCCSMLTGCKKATMIEQTLSESTWTYRHNVTTLAGGIISPSLPEHALTTWCRFCEKLVFVDNLKDHLINSHIQGPASRRSDLQIHKNDCRSLQTTNPTINSGWHCKFCRTNYATEAHLTIHLIDNHKCIHCDAFFQHPSNHLKDVHFCNFCQMFVTDLIAHVKSSFTCPTCRLIIKHADLFRGHSCGLIKVKTLDCKVCKRTFKASDMPQHKRTCSRRGLKVPDLQLCPFCNIYFGTKADLIFHLKAYHE